MLKRRSPPRLLLSSSEHPRGRLDDETILAITSSQPTCLAAAWHVAASWIDSYPGWSVHLPEVTTRYTGPKVFEVLHWLRGP